jgi:formate dehydrogenase beta subunit
MRPLYVDRMPPCNDACPAGENVQAWFAEVQAGRYRAAWDILVRDNPFPAIHGRVCYHPCEDACNRGEIDGPVSIHAVERFLGDLALASGWTFEPVRPPTGKKVLIVGAGPSGLSAAYHLARLGHSVTIHDAGPAAGGMMHFGIPKYRLPREVLDAEVRRLETLGVTIVLNRRVENLLEEQQAGHFDAVFVAVGAHISKRQSIPARDAGRIYDALDFLRSVEFDAEAPKIGRRVAIYGGGNTAMDAARTVRRLGGEPVIIYRRTREQMPAHPFEADEAVEEGVEIRWLRTIAGIEGTTFTVEVMRLDEKGFPQPTGEFETLDADTLVLALGQDSDTAFLRGVPGVEFKKDGTVIVGPDMMTNRAGLFAGGDMVPGDRSVTTAVGHGKKAARHIDRWLGRSDQPSAERPELVTAGMLHHWYHAATLPMRQPVLPLPVRIATFNEVVRGLDADGVAVEARRCLSCGNCFECDGCYGACPEGAIRKLGPGLRYAFDFSLCTGCAVCFEQCPCAAITMVPESSHGQDTRRE